MVEQPNAEVREGALADPAGEVRLRAREGEGGNAGGNECSDDQAQRVEVAGLDSVVDGELREVGRQEGDPRIGNEGD